MVHQPIGRTVRLVAALSGVIAAALPARAQPYTGPDGFGICPFANSALGVTHSTIGPCRPLTDQAMQSFGLAANQTGVVAILRSYAAKPAADLLQQLENTMSLAAPKQFAAAGRFSDYWFPDAADPSNVALGVHFRYVDEASKQQLFQMTYAVDGIDGHFTVIWNRVAAATPPQE